MLQWWLHRISRGGGNLNLQQEVLARNTFNKFDSNKSGSIDVNELRELVETLGVSFTDKELLLAMQELDGDSSGAIECSEFVRWWVERTKGVRKGIISQYSMLV